MTADPTGFDRLVTGGIVPGTTRVELAERELVVPAHATAADMAAVLVAYEGLRRDYLAMRAERDDARRHAAELDARLTRMTHDSAARDRVAPMTAWKDDER